jgi:hypothetical protein
MLGNGVLHELHEADYLLLGVGIERHRRCPAKLNSTRRDNSCPVADGACGAGFLLACAFFLISSYCNLPLDKAVRFRQGGVEGGDDLPISLEAEMILSAFAVADFALQNGREFITIFLLGGKDFGRDKGTDGIIHADLLVLDQCTEF